MAALFTKGENNAKIRKGEGSTGYSTLILHLAPANESGHQTCASSSAGCRKACLYTAGRGAMSNVKNGRIRRTKLYFEDRAEFKRQVLAELAAFVRKCDREGTRPAVRMNGTSDIVWERAWPELFATFPRIQFYDYTKHWQRCTRDYHATKMPPNYRLTFSRSEDNDHHVATVLAEGICNVAMVFDSPNFPTYFEGFPVYTAEDNDLRFLDPYRGGAIAALSAKGKARKDESGFVLPTAETLEYST